MSGGSLGDTRPIASLSITPKTKTDAKPGTDLAQASFHCSGQLRLSWPFVVFEGSEIKAVRKELQRSVAEELNPAIGVVCNALPQRNETAILANLAIIENTVKYLGSLVHPSLSAPTTLLTSGSWGTMRLHLTESMCASDRRHTEIDFDRILIKLMSLDTEGYSPWLRLVALKTFDSCYRVFQTHSTDISSEREGSKHCMLKVSLGDFAPVSGAHITRLDFTGASAPSPEDFTFVRNAIFYLLSVQNFELTDVILILKKLPEMPGLLDDSKLQQFLARNTQQAQPWAEACTSAVIKLIADPVTPVPIRVGVILELHQAYVELLKNYFERYCNRGFVFAVSDGKVRWLHSARGVTGDIAKFEDELRALFPSAALSEAINEISKELRCLEVVSAAKNFQRALKAFTTVSSDQFRNV